MRYVVIGAGAVGGVAGGRLALHDHDVVLVARGEHGRVMAEQGLTIESPDGVENVAVPVHDKPETIAFRAGDVAVVAVKSQDTAGVLHALRSVAPPSTPIVCLQNGVENERAALRLFERVYGICVMCPASHLEPGVVQANSSPVAGILDIGRFPGGVDEVAEAVARDLSASTFVSEPRPDIMRWKYAKLLMNLGNAIEALCGTGLRDSRVYGLAREEAIAVLRAAGIPFASAEEDQARRGDILRMRPIAGQRRGGGSSWQSLERGTGSIEADWLNGEIALLGRLHGVPAPVNSVLQRLADGAARRGDPPGSMTEDEILALLPGAAP